MITDLFGSFCLNLTAGVETTDKLYIRNCKSPWSELARLVRVAVKSHPHGRKDMLVGNFCTRGEYV